MKVTTEKMQLLRWGPPPTPEEDKGGRNALASPFLPCSGLSQSPTGCAYLDASWQEWEGNVVVLLGRTEQGEDRVWL